MPTRTRTRTRTTIEPLGPRDLTHPRRVRRSDTLYGTDLDPSLPLMVRDRWQAVPGRGSPAPGWSRRTGRRHSQRPMVLRVYVSTGAADVVVTQTSQRVWIMRIRIPSDWRERVAPMADCPHPRTGAPGIMLDWTPGAPGWIDCYVLRRVRKNWNVWHITKEAYPGPRGAESAP